MSETQQLTLDQVGVPAEIRDRAKFMWILTALWGPFGWGVCSYVWKVKGQEDSDWYQGQLKQALFVGIAGWVGYALCGLGWFIHVGLGVMGFLAINKGLDYLAPVIGPIALKNAPAAIGTAGQGTRNGDADPVPTTEHAHAAAAGPGVSMEPVEGVNMETWAWAWAHLQQGHDQAQIIGRVQIDPARWERVHAEWSGRMARDGTGGLQQEVGKYFPAQSQQAAPQQAAAQQAAAQQAAAQQAAAHAHPRPHVETAPGPGIPVREPIPLERWVEVSVALEVAQSKGWDSSHLLGNFGMSPADWGNADTWWTQRFQSSTRDQGFLDRYNQLQQYYNEYYHSR